MKPDKSWNALLKPGDATDHFQTSRPLPPFAVTSDYSAVNALYCSELSRLVYKDDAGQRADILSRVGLREVAFFDRGGTQAMLVYSQAWDVAFLVFRGTTEIKDWLTNVRALPTYWRGDAYVHRGFKVALEQVWNEIEKERLECPVYYTGHSLGNALALLAASLRPPKAVYGYGGPPVGNLAFGALLTGQSIFRIVHGADTVPRQLPTLRHVGQVVNLDEIRFAWSLNSLWSPPRKLRCHAPVNYSVALERLL